MIKLAGNPKQKSGRTKEVKRQNRQAEKHWKEWSKHITIWQRTKANRHNTLKEIEMTNRCHVSCLLNYDKRHEDKAGNIKHEEWGVGSDISQVIIITSQSSDTSPMFIYLALESLGKD